MKEQVGEIFVINAVQGQYMIRRSDGRIDIITEEPGKGRAGIEKTDRIVRAIDEYQKAQDRLFASPSSEEYAKALRAARKNLPSDFLRT